MDTLVGTITEIESIIGTIVETAAVPSFAIASFASTTPAVEVGATLSNPAFTASYTYAPQTVTCEDDDGNAVVDVSGTPTSFVMPYSYTETVVGTAINFDLDATPTVGSPDAESTQIIWRPRIYYGRAAPGGSGEAFIESLEFSTVVPGSAMTMNMTGGNAVGAGQKLYWAGPADLGTPTFLHVESSFTGGFFEVGSFSVTNAYAVGPITYKLFESDNTGIGSVTIEVS